MCRLFGVLSSSTVNASYYLKDAPQSLVVQSHIDKKRPQEDGWGIGWFHSAEARIMKSPRAVYREAGRFRRAISQVRGHVVLGHVRSASNPLKLARRELIGLRHTQPFSHAGWVFVHNGTLHIPREVKAELGPWAKFIQGNNDSEVLFYWLLRHLTARSGETGGRLFLKTKAPLKKAVRESIRGLDKIWKRCKTRYPIYKYPTHGLNWVLTDGQTMIAFCYVNKLGFSKSPAFCDRRQSYFELQAKISDQAVVVASEPLAQEPGWRPFRHGQLLIAEKRGRKIATQLLKVA